MRQGDGSRRGHRRCCWRAQPKVGIGHTGRGEARKDKARICAKLLGWDTEGGRGRGGAQALIWESSLGMQWRGQVCGGRLGRADAGEEAAVVAQLRVEPWTKARAVRAWIWRAGQRADIAGPGDGLDWSENSGRGNCKWSKWRGKW